MYPQNITEVHIELTDKCQASCPMCARNVNGGQARNFVGNFEITLDKFKQWFPQDFLSKLNHFYACGNYGDPIIAQDCLEIFSYIRSVSPHCYLGIHTNGSARPVEWWEDLARSVSGNHMCTFGIDGFEESHVLYRRGTSWKKIIENAKAFINAGGNAEIDCLVFKHNQHEVVEFEKQMLDIGFKKINFKYTKRFYDMTHFPVEDKKGNVEYYLEPAIQESVIEFLPLEKISKDISIWETVVESSTLKPKCIEKNEIYVDARGNVFPCCWIGSDWIEQPIVENLPIQKLRNLVVKDTKSKFETIGVPNLNVMSINDIAWDQLSTTLQTLKPWTCVKNCNG
jgi:MoaA/NifB/PqqE/SkfB family radical SAM enzyme